MIYIINFNNFILQKNLNRYHSRKLMYLFLHTLSKFITGKWEVKQIRRAKRGTAVDQWGWDSKEMWQDILNYAQFLEEVATHWILPVTAGYLPTKYQGHLAGSRLVAISKAPKTGILPINVNYVWRRIAAKGLLTNCLP